MSTDFDVREFRNALGQFVTGVAVVTARGSADEAVGMTVNSFSSVSLDPPLILFSIDRTARSLPILRKARGIAVNLLGRRQEHLSDRFARALTDKWAAVERTDAHHDAPLLEGALAQFECEPYATYDGGDHLIFVCKVLRFTSDPDRQPLVFFRGRYTAVDRDDQHEPSWPLPMHY